MAIKTQIDRSSYVPLYIQVMDALQDYIEDGTAKAGEKLPGEPELCRQFDVSRTVIRQALRELEHEGLIVRRKGKGTFVAEPKIRENLFQELTGFYQDMEAKGHPPFSRVLKQEVIPAPRRVASLLKLKEHTPLVQIDRLRYVQDEPIVLVSSYLPHARCPGLVEADLSERSLYALLAEEYGIQIVRGRRVLEAVPANEVEAELLQVKKGAPLILLDSVGYLADGTPIEYFHALHRGDRSRFEVELIRLRDRGQGRDGGHDLIKTVLERADDSGQ